MTGARLLSLAATPTFALMAAITAVREASAGPVFCGPGDGATGGMALMYLLMGAFHLAPWLRPPTDRPPSSH